MAHDRDKPHGLGEDPLTADGLLAETFYVSGPHARAQEKIERAKPTHYKVVSISLYSEDIERLDAMVKELKKRGHTKVSKSQLIRFALDTVNIDKLPRGY
jgi:hypothetical protein